MVGFCGLDLETGAVGYRVDLGGSSLGGMPDGRLLRACDGRVWIFVDSNLVRVDPADGSFETILSTRPGRLAFAEGDLYLFGDTIMRRVAGLVVPQPRQ
jgi:hypothetical protein